MRFRSEIFIVFLFAGFSLSARAAAPSVCDAPFEAMVDLRLPRLNTPAVWDAQYAPRGQSVAFTSALPMPDGTVMAVGNIANASAGDARNILMVRLDRRGRSSSTALTPAKPGEQPVATLAIGNGYLVLSNDHDSATPPRRHARLSWYDADGHFQHALDLGAGEDADGTALAANPKGGFLVAFNSTEHRSGAAPRAMLALFGAGGAKLWQRGYTPGVAGEIDGLGSVPHGYVAAGALRLDDGRMAGWALRVGDNGAVIWQKVFPRGGGATFRTASFLNGQPADGQNVIVAGTVTPSGGGADATWIAELGGDGNILWQRYLRHAAFAFTPFGLATNAEGQVLAAVNAHAVSGEGNRDHIRLLTLTAHGKLAQDEAYIDGIGATGSSFLLRDDGTRLLAATIVSDDHPLDFRVDPGGGIVATGAQKATTSGPAGFPVRKGWIVVAPSAEPFDDPCSP